MKKILYVLFLLILSINLYAVKNSFSVGTVFTTYFLKTQIKKDDSKIDEFYKKIIHASSDGLYKEFTYGAGFSLDLNTDFLYLSTQFVFPSKTQSDFFKIDGSLEKNIFVIFDSQAGICYKFFEDKAYPLFLGGGLGFNTFHINSSGKIPLLGSLSYTRTDMMLGLGGTASFSYYFTKTFGLNFIISDTIYFMNIRTLRLISIDGKELKFEEKEKRNSFNAINILGNAFNLKMSISFRF